MRLNQFLAKAGLGSRRKVESLILAGKIEINGTVTNELSQQVDPGRDTVILHHEGKAHELHLDARTLVYLLNKPVGYISTRFDPKNSKPTVYELLPDYLQHLDAVGRLDIMTSGLLLFTNHGELLHRLTHPSYQIPRVYRVKLEASLSPEQEEKLGQGVVIDGRRTKPPRILHIDESRKRIHLEIREGRNREIRRLFEMASCSIEALKRTEYSFLKLVNMSASKGRLLKENEIASLLTAVDLKN